MIVEATFLNQLLVTARVANEVDAKAIAVIATLPKIATSRDRDFLRVEGLELGDEGVGKVEENILIEAPNQIGEKCAVAKQRVAVAFQPTLVELARVTN